MIYKLSVRHASVTQNDIRGTKQHTEKWKGRSYSEMVNNNSGGRLHYVCTNAVYGLQLPL